MKKTIIIPLLISLALVFSPSTSLGQTSSAPTVEDLQKQIQLLLSQMSSLQKEITTLKLAAPATAPTTPTPATLPPSLYSPLEIDESEVGETETFFVSPPNLIRSLFRGSRGEDVRQLQEFLAQDPAIYPEGMITGYYGAGTEAAVKRWQAKNGVPAVGVIGRQTIAKFKALYSGVTDASIFTRPPVAVQPISPTDLTPAPKPDPGAICPTLPTVDSCPAGEERIVTYKSAQCGVYYACKPRQISRADNTIATLKKISSIQTDNRYTVNLYDPEGIQKFAVYNSKGAEINSGYPACRKEWSSPAISADSSEFPLKLTLSDCASSQYSTTLSTSVVVRQVAEGLTFPYKFSNGKIVYSSEEARSYCYANGPSSGQGVAGECETKFGVVYTNITTTTTSSGRAIYSTDAFSACMAKYGFSAEAKQIKTWAQSSEAIPWSALTNAAQNSVPVCEREYYGQQTIETGAAMCADGKDNDGDGFIDSADPSCVGYTTTTTTQTTITTSGQSCDSALTTLLGTGCHYMYNDSVGNPVFCDNSMTRSAKRGATATTSGCTAPTVTTTTVSPAGQKEQVWNSLGLKSWIRTDADSARIEQLKSACISVPSGSNVWTPNAGVSTSADFGMPDATKCSRASACTSGQYFDGAACVTGTTTTWNTTTSGSCDSALTALLGTGCHYMYNDSAGNQTYCDGPMTKSAKRGDTATTAGCSSSTTGSWPTDQASCTTRGYNWCVATSSWCQTGSCPTSTTGGGTTYAGDANSCPGFAYSRWDSSSRRYCQLNTESRCDYNYPSYLTNGSNYTAANCPTGSSSVGGTAILSCSASVPEWPVQYGSYCLNNSRTQYVPLSSPTSSSAQSCTGADTPVSGCTPPSGSTTTTTTTSTGSCSQYGDGWHVMGDNNCYNSGMTEYRTANGTLYSCSNTPSSGCSSSSTTSSGTCGSGYYWNGSTCVTSSTSGSSCASGQYWNGTNCVTSTTSSGCSTPSNCYDSAVCASSGWYWYNGGCWSSPQTSTTSTTACPSGQYWSGSSCVATSPSDTTTTCPSGNYWNGSACVPSTTPSAAIYDQMKNQLRSMEIILRGLLGR